MVFQSYALYPHMTVYQNMAFGLKLRHVDPKVIDESVRAAAEVLEISELLQRKPKELSGGQRQRVALGRAIVREPNVFLLDEPLSNLDAKLRVQMRTEITKLHEKLQTTFIYVTHDQTEAMTMGDVIVVMKNGYIQQADSPITLFEDPTNLFVATFLGSPQMNIVEAKLVLNGDKVGAVLAGVEENTIWLSANTSKQIIASGIDFEKPILFGIRPDHISLSDKGVPAHIEVVEQLGDETLLHTKIANHDKYITIKLPLTGSLKSGQDVNINFSLDRIYLFDKELEHSLIGVPSYNKMPVSFESNDMILGNNRLSLSDEFVSHCLDTFRTQKVFVGFKPEDVLLEPTPECHKIDVKVDFIEQRTNYKAVFAKVNGIDQYLVFRAPHDVEIKENANMSVYVACDKIGLYAENGDSLVSREELLPNIAQATVSNKDGKTIIQIEGGEKLVYEGLDILPGKYSFKLKQDKVKVCFNKKMAKSMKIEYVAPASKNTLSVSCYDEEPTGTKNIIFAQIKGFKDYITIETENNFSVYKMPKFKIEVPADGFELIEA